MFSCIRRINSSSSSSSPPQSSYTVRRIEGLARELMQNERDYIKSLEKGIENYLNPIASNNSEVPEDLRYQKFKLFGNIEEIFSLHKSMVLPHLLSCGDNIHQIAETLINLIQSDAFYCYINYAINHLQAQEFLVSHAAFFTQLQKKCNDRLGVMSFIILPIQKVPRYPLILEEMIKELSVDMHVHKQALASLCLAKKKIEKFLARVNQAMTINDIIETHEMPVKLQCGLITCFQIEFGVSINEPTMLLVPSFSSQHGYRSPVSKKIY
jgi:RhoGEF domain